MRKKRILIDAGHGGRNLGCEIPNYGYESAYTLEIANRILLLAQADKYMELEVSRFGDQYLSLSERWEMAADMDADLAISLHVDSFAPNGYPDPRAHGAWSVFKNGDTERLVRTMQRRRPAQLVGTIGGSYRAVAKDGRTGRAYNVLTGYHCPAVLTEMFFATNPDDVEFARSREGKATIASWLYSCIAEYCYFTK